MGDRGNVKLIYPSKPGAEAGAEAPAIYFYTHWRGSELRQVVALALTHGRGRWDDPAYLARIIFCTLVGDDFEGDTGFGIDVQPGENEHPMVVVDFRNKSVYEEPHRPGLIHMRPSSYAGFIELVAQAKGD